jgi:hypothetical protein
MKEIFTILVVLLFAFPLQAGTLYKWVDRQGVVNFTDDLTKVPPSYRNQVEVEESKDVQEEVNPSPPQAVNPDTREEEIKTDIYGRDEAWWRERVRPWKEQLKEATENYERAQKKFAQRTAELSQKGLVSHARYTTESDKFKEETMKYEVQIAEANEMLRKLSKEAVESRANPDWLK